MTARQRKAREAAMGAAMAELVRNPNFNHFIEHIRDLRELVVLDACNESVIASQRLSMAAVGEIRAYSAIINAYEETANREAETSDSPQA